MTLPRDHGGGIDAAVARHGGTRTDWLDLSTGINPVPYPLPALTQDEWCALPDAAACATLIVKARQFWNIHADAAVLAVPGASAAIAQLPRLRPTGRVAIPGPTYNEHAAAFANAGWTVADHAPLKAQVAVHPNNPDGRIWHADEMTAPLTIIDESFCDVMPEASLIHLATRPNTVVLKSFGKFWGLAGLRLGFVIGDPVLVAGLAEALGPWPVSGPALAVGSVALCDTVWADATNARLRGDAKRLDALMTVQGATVVGGTTLFRLYQVDDAAAMQETLARSKILGRVFPYDATWLRLGLPAPDRWQQLEAAF